MTGRLLSTISIVFFYSIVATACKSDGPSSDNEAPAAENTNQQAEDQAANGKEAAEGDDQYQEHYDLWSQVLKKFVYASKKDGVALNRVKYAAVGSDPNFQKVFTWYKNAPVPQGYKKQMAFWVNAYNVYVFKLMHDKGSPAKITDIPQAFKQPFYKIAGQKRSLDQIEKGQVKSLGNPAYHFALVCGAVSCPDIIFEAYLPEKVNAQMRSNTWRFFHNEDKGLRVDHATKTVHLTTLGKWYADEFGGEDGFRQYAAKFFKDKKTKAAITGYTVKWIPYNWNSN